MKWYKISDLLKINIKNLFVYSPIFEADTFCNYIMHTFPEWYFLTCEETTAEAQADFVETFLTWRDETEENYTRLYNALNTEYSALVGFEKSISGTIKDELHKGHKESTATDIKTSNAENTIETPSLITHDTSTNAYNGGVTLASREQDTASTNATRTRSADSNYSQKVGTANNNYKTVSDIDENNYDYNERSFNQYKESGRNTPATDLIEKEFVLRFKNLTKTIINDFVNSYCIYVEGV